MAHSGAAHRGPFLQNRTDSICSPEAMMSDQKLEIIRQSLEHARTWEGKGYDSWRNIAWSNKCISSALMNLLSIAAENFPKCSDAVTFLLENGTIPLLRRVYEQIERLIDEVDAGRIPSSTYGGNYPHLVFVHLSWAVQEFSLGEGFVAISERRDNAANSTPFWCEYARAMGALVRDLPFHVAKMRKLKGQEEYWVTYLYLIEAVSSSRSVEEALQNVDHAFIIRNSDNRIKDDGYEIEGSRAHPVRWDFRRDSLMTYVIHKSSRT